MPDLTRAQSLLGDLCAALGVKVPAGCELRVVTAAQAALLEFGTRHPFCELKVEFRAGEPYMATAEFAEMVERFLLTG